MFTALNLLPSIAATAMGEQLQPAAQRDELAARRPDRRPVVLAKVGDGLEVRRQALGQPHQLDVALRLALQPAARRDLVDVAVDVDLQQQTRVIAGPARRLRHNPLEPQRPQVQLVDEHVDHPDRVLLRHIVVQIVRKQNALPAILTLDEATHRTPRSKCFEILAKAGGFHTASVHRRTSTTAGALVRFQPINGRCSRHPARPERAITRHLVHPDAKNLRPWP